MNKAEFIDALADRAGLTKADAARAVDAMFAQDGIIAETIRRGQKIQITGFGTFDAKVRKARQGRNPRTGAMIEIAETVIPCFRPGKGLKDAIGGGPEEAAMTPPVPKMAK